MKVTWLSGASLLFEGERARILVDPVSVDAEADVILITRNQADHFCAKTLASLLEKNPEAVLLASRSAYAALGDLAEKYNAVPLSPHSVWSEKGITFYAVRAENADPLSAGFILDDANKTYYVSGDTLYNEDIFTDLPDDIYAVFLPINGVGNNMNMTDAKCFCQRVGAEYVVPLHCGLFDGIDMNGLEVENKIVPKFYKEVVFE
jgi:L-ascorbate metabolism protein UlaG (beta-lactamase superfamily)